MADDILIFGNSAATPLIEDIRTLWKKNGDDLPFTLTAGDADIGFHNDGEPWVEILSEARRRECVVVATIAPAIVDGVARSVNDHAMQTLVLLDALRNASAKITTVVFPYLGYLRQDRRSGKKTHRTAVTARIMAEVIEVVGRRVPHACAVEIHALQVEAFFRAITFENIPALSTIAAMLPRASYEDAVVVAPDRGAVDRADALKKYLDLRDLAVVYKSRPEPGKAKAERIAGDVRGRRVIIADDMIDTAGTLCSAADFLTRECGATAVVVVAAHGLFSRDALARISESPIEQVYVLDTVPPRDEVRAHPKIRVLSSAPLLGHAIRSIRMGESLRALGRKSPRE